MDITFVITLILILTRVNLSQIVTCSTVQSASSDTTVSIGCGAGETLVSCGFSMDATEENVSGNSFNTGSNLCQATAGTGNVIAYARCCNFESAVNISCTTFTPTASSDIDGDCTTDVVAPNHSLFGCSLRNTNSATDESLGAFPFPSSDNFTSIGTLDSVSRDDTTVCRTDSATDSEVPLLNCCGFSNPNVILQCEYIISSTSIDDETSATQSVDCADDQFMTSCSGFVQKASNGQDANLKYVSSRIRSNVQGYNYTLYTVLNSL